MTDIAEAALKALYDTDTRPGPNAGKSIKHPDAEPVAWQFRLKQGNGNWNMWRGTDKPNLNRKFYEFRPLYTKP